MSEYSICITVLLLFFVLPLIDLLSLASGAGVLLLENMQQATKASQQQSFSDALAVLPDEANRFSTTGLCRYLSLQPIAGYRNTGTDLYICADSFRTGDQASKVFPDNQPLPPPIDTSTYVYELCAKTTYYIYPLVSLHAVPFIGSVPGLGLPVAIKFETRRMIEHPLGFCASKVASALNGGTLPISLNLNGLQSPGQLNQFTDSGWDYPQIYQLIQSAGETVVAENVLIVQANSPTWTSAGVQAAPGDKVWVDFRANGEWKTSAGSSSVNANGVTAGGVKGAPQKGNGFPLGCMLGRMDSTNQVFYLGEQVWNYPPPGSGPISLKINDSEYKDNSGSMVCRIIIAR